MNYVNYHVDQVTHYTYFKHGIGADGSWSFSLCLASIIFFPPRGRGVLASPALSLEFRLCASLATAVVVRQAIYEDSAASTWCRWRCCQQTWIRCVAYICVKQIREHTRSCQCAWCASVDAGCLKSVFGSGRGQPTFLFFRRQQIVCSGC